MTLISHSFKITDMCCTSMKWAPAINTTVPHFLLLDSKLTSRYLYSDFTVVAYTLDKLMGKVIQRTIHSIQEIPQLTQLCRMGKNARICNLSLFEMTFPLMISGFVLFYTLELGNEQRDERLYNGTYTKSTEWK